MFKFKCVFFLIVLFFIANNFNAQSLSDKSVEELKLIQKDAVAKEDYDLADKIKLQIKRLEDNKDKISTLESEKETAILLEDFDKVIDLDKQINALKNGTVYVKETVKQVQPEAPKEALKKKSQIFYENGVVHMEGDVIDGIRTGPWKYFTKKGVLESEGEFLNGDPTGLWKWYTPKGKVWRKANFSKPKLTNSDKVLKKYILKQG